MLSDAQWAKLEPLVEACRPKGKTPAQDLRRTVSALLWRHQNGAKWRAVPAELGPDLLPAPRCKPDAAGSAHRRLLADAHRA
jgi:transposase